MEGFITLTNLFKGKDETYWDDINICVDKINAIYNMHKDEEARTAIYTNSGRYCVKEDKESILKMIDKCNKELMEKRHNRYGDFVVAILNSFGIFQGNKKEG